MMSDTLYIIPYIPLVDKTLQFNLYRSIREEYLAVRSEPLYITFPLSTDIRACQVSNDQFCHINPPLYTADASHSCSYALFLQNKDKINNFCILSVINKTCNETLNVNDNFWSIAPFRIIKAMYHLFTV